MAYADKQARDVQTGDDVKNHSHKILCIIFHSNQLWSAFCAWQVYVGEWRLVTLVWMPRDRM